MVSVYDSISHLPWWIWFCGMCCVVNDIRLMLDLISHMRIFLLTILDVETIDEIRETIIIMSIHINSYMSHFFYFWCFFEDFLPNWFTVSSMSVLDVSLDSFSWKRAYSFSALMLHLNLEISLRSLNKELDFYPIVPPIPTCPSSPRQTPSFFCSAITLFLSSYDKSLQLGIIHSLALTDPSDF